MSELNIRSATTSSYENSGMDYEIPTAQTDGITDLNEFEWINTRWSIQYGIYKNARSVRNAIDALARWTIGKGYITFDNLQKLILMNIKGNGKDTFNSILKNIFRMAVIGGDGYGEIVKNKEGFLVNIKPLDPSTIAIVYNKKGMIKKYRQYSKTGTNKEFKEFKPEEIFHLCRNRIADEIHGTSLIDILEWIVTAQEEAMRDEKKLMHRNIQPIRIWKLDEDNPTKIAEFKSTVKNMKEDFEDLFIPKNTVETEVSAVAPNQTLDPKAWIDMLDKMFYETAGVPKIIVGNSSEFTEAAGKIVYLSFEQTVEEWQLDIEEQVLSQLGIRINLEFPASLRNEILTGQSKSETMQAATPEDTNIANMSGGGT